MAKLKRLTLQEAQAEALKKEQKYQREQIELRSLRNMILEIRDAEGLRQAQLRFIADLAAGDIEPKVASAVATMLKHQESLLAKTVNKSDNLNEQERARAIEMAKGMSALDMLSFLGNFKIGMEKLAKQAKEAQPTTIQAIEVKDVTNSSS